MYIKAQKHQIKRLDGPQYGASLIEAMIALFIFSIGALGVAAMQAASMVRGDDTRQRTIAIWKAQELVDRIKASKTIDSPNGMIAEYIVEIANDNSDNGIGKVDSDDEFECPTANLPLRCDDQNGAAAAVCTAEQVVKADVWSVMCDASTGLVPLGDPVNGSVGLRNLEVALENTGTEYRLYFEWLSRTSNNNLDTSGTDSGLQNSDGSARNVITNLCGDDESVDSRLEAYCLRFQ